MCIKTILDASMFSRFAGEEMRAWRSWVKKGDGILVYTLSGKFGKELQNSQKIKDYLISQRRAGIQLVSNTELERASEELKHQEFKSNDRHVLQLAFASKALVLCTGDQDLKHDFLKVLPASSSGNRAIYPHESKDRTRSAFLAKRRCHILRS